MKTVPLALVTLLLLLAFIAPAASSQTADPDSLPIHLTEEEKLRLHEIGIRHRSTAAPTGTPRNPAEWEPSEGVIIRWPLGISIAIVAEMSEDVMVTTIVGSASQQNSAMSAYASGGVNMANTQFIIAPTDSYWTRDYGPWFIFEDTSLAIVDHIYNRPRPNDDVIPQKIGLEWGLDVYGLDLIHAGGNHMSDGLGMSASTELVYHENPGKTQTEIHDLMRDYLGNAYTVLGYIESGGIHHIDCWAKYLNPTTILVKEVSAGDPSHDLLDARADYFSQQISPWGELYTVVRVYCPAGTAYTNSLILNDKVLVPVFGSAWDDDALQVYEDAMPGYEVLGFTGSWLDDDAIHCRAMGVPDRGMLFLDHVPFKTSDITAGDYPIEARVVPCSGAALLSDQLRVYYSTDGDTWDYVFMNPAGNPDSYVGDIPAQAEDSVVRYYLQAGDASGRREYHPYVGRPDPHEFVSVCPNNPLVNVTPDGPLVVCSGTSQTLGTRLTGGLGPFTYQWTVNDLDLPGATDPSLEVVETGSHEYNCRVWGAGCFNERTDPSPVEVTWQSEPVFQGISSVSAPPETTCTLDLAWSEGGPVCAGPVYYSVYRSTSAAFTPDASNLLIAGVGDTGYRDTEALVTDRTYYYIVRARDDSNGAQEDNLVVRQGAPAGPGGGDCATGSGCTMSVNVTPNGTTAACAGEVIVLAATPSGGTPPYTYQWTEDGVPIPGGTEDSLAVSHEAVGAHTYNCLVADSGACSAVADGYDVVGEWVSCGSVITVADGTEGGTTPLTVAKNGSDLVVHWDATTQGCTSDAYHLIWGWGTRVSTYDVAGADCSLDASGTHLWTSAPITSWNWAWFLVVGSDAEGTEGGWGYDSLGNPRSSTASGRCGTSLLDSSACLP